MIIIEEVYSDLLKSDNHKAEETLKALAGAFYDAMVVLGQLRVGAFTREEYVAEVLALKVMNKEQLITKRQELIKRFGRPVH